MKFSSPNPLLLPFCRSTEESLISPLPPRDGVSLASLDSTPDSMGLRVSEGSLARGSSCLSLVLSDLSLLMTLSSVSVSYSESDEVFEELGGD